MTMLSTHLTQFLKNIFELLESRNVDSERRDESIMSNVVGFVANVFKNCESSVDGMQLSEAFRSSLVKDLCVIRDDISILIAHLNPEIKLIDIAPDLKIYDSNEPVIGISYTKDIITNDSTQLEDYYWNSGDFVSFIVVQESDTTHTNFEKPLLNNGDLEKIRRIVNDTKYKEIQNASNRSASSESNVTNMETMTKVKENVFETVKRLPNNLSAALSVSENLTSTASRISQNQPRHCTVNNICVRSVDTLNDLNAKLRRHSTRHISILHLNNLAVINASFAVDKLVFNFIVREATQYKCWLCSVYIAATVESLNCHIQSSFHMDRLAKVIIWVSSSGTCVYTLGIHLYKCCICLNTGGIIRMNEHFESIAHKQSSSSATALCGSILKAIGNAMDDREINAQTLASNFRTVLDQHKIKLSKKQRSCDTCNGAKIAMNPNKLYAHITQRKHWGPYLLRLNERFAKMPKIRNHVDQTYRGFMKVYNSKDKCYCQICNIFIDGVLTETMNCHIKSYAHCKFLVLFLQNKKIRAFIDLNSGGHREAGELILPEIETFEIHDAGSYIIFDYYIAIDKYSWNGMMLFQTSYYCLPCHVTVLVTDRTKHIADDFHKIRLSYWPVNWEHLARKSENNDSVFCVPCGSLQTTNMPIHPACAHHKEQIRQLVSACDNWRLDMNSKYISDICPFISDAERDILIDIFIQNRLIALNTSNMLYCNVCLKYFYASELRQIYDHIVCSEFSAHNIFAKRFYDEFKSDLDDVCAEIPNQYDNNEINLPIL